MEGFGVVMKKLKYTIWWLFLLAFICRLPAGEWQSGPPLNTPRAGAVAVSYDNKIFVFGGKSRDNTILKSVEVYDPSRGDWDDESVPDFEKARYNAAAVVFDGKIFLIGGRGDEEVLESVEIYDPVQNLWQEGQNLREEREGCSAVVLDGHIYVIGGQKNENELIDEIEWYDESKNKWKEVDGNMEHPRVAPFSAAVRDTFYMFGGYYFGLTHSFLRGTVSDHGFKWKSGPHLSQPRAYGATVLKGDSLFLIGGEVQNGKTDQVEIYHLGSKRYYSAQPLPTKRSGITGVNLNDTIYVIGGYGSDNGVAVNTVDLYSAAATAIGPLPAPVPKAHLLINGYPNPFNGTITLRISVKQSDDYGITVYNARGKRIRSLYHGAIRHTLRLTWSGEDDAGQETASGVYFLVVQSPTQVVSYKMVYVR